MSMAYFDNAATTFPKPEAVYAFMDSFYRNNGASVGRGGYEAALSAGKMLDETRTLLQTLLHCPTKQVIFTPTATLALNIVLQGLIRKGVRNVYISPFEHNAVTRILYPYEKGGQIVVHKLTVTPELCFDIERIRYQFEAVAPDLVIVTHASNVLGVIAPVEDIFSLSKLFNAFNVVDMAQTAGLVECNIGLDIFDFAIFAGHKTLYGPTGASGFIMKPDIDLPPILFGGTGFESMNQDMPISLPERFEIGTININAIAGLNAALKWLKPNTIDSRREDELGKRQKLLELFSNYWFIKVVGNFSKNNYVGIVSCIFDGISSDSVGNILNKAGVAVRAGLHCAPLAHEFIGTAPAGTVRFSVSCFTNDEDFKKLQEALDFIEENL